MARAHMDRDFSEFMAARWAALFRTAHLLTGDSLRAEELLQDAFARTCAKWSGIRDKGAAVVIPLAVNSAGGWACPSVTPVATGSLCVRRTATVWTFRRPEGATGAGLADGVVVGSGMEDSVVHDLVGGQATKSMDLPGTATLSATGQRIITVKPTAGDDGTVITAWTKGSEGWDGSTVTGVATRADAVRWLDADTALVSAWATGSGNDLYACSAEELRCTKLELPHGTGTVKLG